MAGIMTDTTKPDLSREAVEHIASCVDTGDLFTETEFSTVAATLRALLDAKEEAERECERLRWEWSESCDERDEALAANAAAWEAGFEAGDHHGRDVTPACNPYATEAKHD